MPVTIRLSRHFCDTFGEEIANELVEWFNQVDATYRLELREQNEANFARFDARLEQRLAELGAALRTEFHAALGSGLGDLRKELDGRISGLEGLLHREIAGLRTDLIKWMFVFWATSALAVLGLALR